MTSPDRVKLATTLQRELAELQELERQATAAGDDVLAAQLREDQLAAIADAANRIADADEKRNKLSHRIEFSRDAEGFMKSPIIVSPIDD
jgi:ribosomal 50S subunit-associated protein YjgA (DUF615 family)